MQLLILTGQRRNEVAGMRWVDVDLKERLWHIPAEITKNHALHNLALSLMTAQFRLLRTAISERV